MLDNNSIPKWKYASLTWAEIKDRVNEDTQPVVVIPIGSVEQHGHHLPLATDNIIAETILDSAGKEANGDILVAPIIPYSFDETHMDFPGTVSIEIETCINYISLVAISIAKHGFKHILIANSHGLNNSLGYLAAQKCAIETGIVCAFVTINAAADSTLIQDVIDKHRKSTWGGIGHACEVETSLMLYISKQSVDMSKAVKETGQLKLKYFNWDYPESSAYGWQDFWSRFSSTGVCGDPSVATEEFGKLIFKTTVTRFIELAREFRTIPIRPRIDHH